MSKHQYDYIYANEMMLDLNTIFFYRLQISNV